MRVLGFSSWRIRLPYGFSLLELLVVVAVTGVLASLLLPALLAAREKAQFTVVTSELQQLGLALEMYSADHNGQVPPVRENCNSDLAHHWCQLPVELATSGYVPKGPDGGLASRFEDRFDPGHTYKYAAPGPLILNNTPGAFHKLWVPEDYPINSSSNGQWVSDREVSPVRWVVWSLGPRPNAQKSMDRKGPLAKSTWYRRTGDSGVIARWAHRDGLQQSTP